MKDIFDFIEEKFGSYYDMNQAQQRAYELLEQWDNCPEYEGSYMDFVHEYVNENCYNEQYDCLLNFGYDILEEASLFVRALNEEYSE